MKLPSIRVLWSNCFRLFLKSSPKSEVCPKDENCRKRNITNPRYTFFIVSFLWLPLTVCNITSGGERATSLSTVTKHCAGQTLSSYHRARHWLYCLLAVRHFFFLFYQFIFYQSL